MLKTCTPVRMSMMKAYGIQTPAFFSTITESYTETQAKKGRPVSPHVTIYRCGMFPDFYFILLPSFSLYYDILIFLSM